MTTATPVQSKAHRPADVPLVQYRDGSIYAMSLSEPGTTYLVQLAPLSCSCKGFTYRGACCHTAAALARFGVACAWCGEQRADVRTFTNGADGGSELALCEPCLTTAQAPASWWAQLQEVR